MMDWSVCIVRNPALTSGLQISARFPECAEEIQIIKYSGFNFFLHQAFEGFIITAGLELSLIVGTAGRAGFLSDILDHFLGVRQSDGV